MLNLILKIYQKYKKENFKSVLQRFRQLPIHIIIILLILVISAVLSFVALFSQKDLVWCWITMAIELASTVALALTSEKHFIDNSNSDMDLFINRCQTIYVKVFQKYLKSKEHLNIMLGRANDEINKLQIKIDKKYDDLKKTNQILIIPIMLAILKALWSSTTDVSESMNTSLFAIMLYLAVYAIINVVVTLINYDYILQKNKLQNLADDLQGIIDVMVNFELFDNLLSSNKDAEDNSEKKADASSQLGTRNEEPIKKKFAEQKRIK